MPWSNGAQERINQAWGKNAVICLFSGAEAERLEQAIWSSLGAFLRLGFLRQPFLQPGRLPTLLAAPLAAALIEVGSAGVWTIYRNPTIIANGDELGMPIS